MRRKGIGQKWPASFQIFDCFHFSDLVDVVKKAGVMSSWCEWLLGVRWIHTVIVLIQSQRVSGPNGLQLISAASKAFGYHLIYAMRLRRAPYHCVKPGFDSVMKYIRTERRHVRTRMNRASYIISGLGPEKQGAIEVKYEKLSSQVRMFCAHWDRRGDCEVSHGWLKWQSHSHGLWSWVLVLCNEQSIRFLWKYCGYFWHTTVVITVGPWCFPEFDSVRRFGQNRNSLRASTKLFL